MSPFKLARCAIYVVVYILIYAKFTGLHTKQGKKIVNIYKLRLCI